MCAIVYNMDLELNGVKRETLIDPLYKRIDSNGKVYLDKKLVGQEVLIIPLKPVPQDKIDFIKIGRT